MLQKLFEQWRTLKQAEETAKDNRAKIEEEILAIVKPCIGTNRVPEVSGMKIVVSETKTWDQKQLYALSAEIENFPFELEETWKPVTKGIEWIKTNAPDAWKKILPALTIKPAKPAFSYEEKKEGVA